MQIKNGNWIHCYWCGKRYQVNKEDPDQMAGYCDSKCRWLEARDKEKKKELVKIKCEYCGKEAVISKGDQDSLGDFCSVECAEKAYEDQRLEQELQSENPNIAGLEEALERRI